MTEQIIFEDNEENIHGDVMAAPSQPMPLPGDPIPEPVEPEELPCPRVEWEDENGTP